MLCQVCQKKEATVHFTEIVDDKITKLHLCGDCAKEKGIGFKPPFALNDLISSLTDLKVKGKEEESRCPQCGLSFREFRESGRLGCGRCYQTFGESLSPLIKTLHKGTHHTGKVPVAHPPEEVKPELKRLKKALQDAVEKEEFEKAAQLRDMIKGLGKRDSSPRRKTPKKQDR